MFFKRMQIAVCFMAVASPTFAAVNNFDKFIDCAKQESIKYSNLNESADSIAKVAVFSCSKYAYAYLQEDKAFDIISPTARVDAVKKLSDSVEPAAMKAVMDVRMSRLGK